MKCKKADNTSEKGLDRLGKVRALLLDRYPFFGFIAVGLPLKTATVGSACTDGKEIIFDPAFLKRLTDQEIIFLFCHEILHICLKHISRQENRDLALWNLACDIVVNSNLCMSMGVDEMMVAGRQAITKGPSGEPGYLYSAEEMYELLASRFCRKTVGGYAHPDSHAESEDHHPCNPELSEYPLVDRHDFWPDREDSILDMDRKSLLIEKAFRHAQAAGAGSGLPPALKKIELEFIRKKQVPWQLVCRDFIQSPDRSNRDYNYRPPERRIIGSDCIYPGFNPINEELTKDVLVFIDKSASMDKRQITTVMNEIIFAVKDKYLSGKMGYFDMAVSKMVPFSEALDIIRQRVPVSGGGTSFHCIFDYIHKMNQDNISGIIIMTDGYAFFPPESVAKGLPVLWIIVGTKQKVPWGKCIHIQES